MAVLKKIGNKMVFWLKAARAPFFTATIVPISFAGAYAWQQTGNFNWLYFFITLIGIILIHAGTDLMNDYFDYLSGTDNINQELTPFAGGAQLIQRNEISPQAVLKAGCASLMLAALIGLYLNYILPGNLILILGIIGIASAYSYTAPPFKLAYRGLGEFVVGLNFGPLVVVGTYYVQTFSVDPKIILASLPIAFLITSVLYINQFPDYVADKSTGKNNIVVRLGKEKALIGYYLLIILTYLIIILEVIFSIFPIYTLLTLFTIPLAFKALNTARKYFNQTPRFIPAQAATIGLHSLIGLILTLGFILDKII